MHATRFIMIAAVVSAAMIGCRNRSEEQLAQQGAMNEAAIRLIMDEAARNAVVAEHTIYSHHFVPNDVVLNELGERQVDTLAEAYRAAPGPLNVARGDSSDAQYRGRVQTVLRRLAQGGVNTDRIKVTQGLPGGEGMSSARAAELVEQRPGGVITGGAGSGSTAEPATTPRGR